MMLLVPNSKVSPSGIDLATNKAPMPPVAPTLFSMTTGRFRMDASLGPNTLATTSVGPPFENGTMMRMGFSFGT